MIGKDEIDRAVALINPQVQGINGIVDNFGGAEAAPLLRDLIATAGIDDAALRGFGLETLERMIHEHLTNDGWDPRPFVEGMVHGFIIGVLAAREETDVD